MAKTETHEFLTVPELAALLRVKERKVYDLAANGSVPCSRATGKLLFPEAAVRAWISGTQSGVGQKVDRPPVFLGSHDPLLEWALRQSQCGLATFFDGSQDGVDKFCSGAGVAAGLHLYEAASDDWNVPHVKASCAGQDAVLAAWARRRRGMVVPQSRQAEFSDVSDIANLRVVARQAGSGADSLLRSLIRNAGIEVTFTEPARSENDAVLAVVEGRADVAFGLEAVSTPFNLGFVPVLEERFDLLVDRKAMFDEPMQTLLAFCQSDVFHLRVESMAGYDINDLGKVRWNA